VAVVQVQSVRTVPMARAAMVVPVCSGSMATTTVAVAVAVSISRTWQALVASVAAVPVLSEVPMEPQAHRTLVAVAVAQVRSVVVPTTAAA
jgi:hypothetical protein